MITLIKALCLCCLLLLATDVKAASEEAVLAEIVWPANTRVQTVSSTMQYNGKAMAIASLQSPKDATTFASSIKQLWSTAGKAGTPGFIESQLPGWTLISRVQGQYNIAVQLRQAQTVGKTHQSSSGAQGFVSVVRIDGPVVVNGHGPFSDLQSLFNNQSIDAADTSNLSVYASPTSLHRTHELYVPKLLDAGWRVLADTQLDDGWVTMLSKDHSRLELSFLNSSEFGSVVVVHEVSSK